MATNITIRSKANSIIISITVWQVVAQWYLNGSRIIRRSKANDISISNTECLAMTWPYLTGKQNCERVETQWYQHLEHYMTSDGLVVSQRQTMWTVDRKAMVSAYRTLNDHRWPDCTSLASRAITGLEANDISTSNSEWPAMIWSYLTGMESYYWIKSGRYQHVEHWSTSHGLVISN